MALRITTEYPVTALKSSAVTGQPYIIAREIPFPPRGVAPTPRMTRGPFERRLDACVCVKVALSKLLSVRQGPTTPNRQLSARGAERRATDPALHLATSDVEWTGWLTITQHLIY